MKRKGAVWSIVGVTNLQRIRTSDLQIAGKSRNGVSTRLVRVDQFTYNLRLFFCDSTGATRINKNQTYYNDMVLLNECWSDILIHVLYCNLLPFSGILYLLADLQYLPPPPLGRITVSGYCEAAAAFSSSLLLHLLVFSRAGHATIVQLRDNATM